MTEQPGGGTYAGFWRRFVAYLIDNLIISAISQFLFIPFLAMLGIGSWKAMEYDPDPEMWIGLLIAVLVGMSFLILVSFILGWLYYALMESSTNQGTLGKMALGIQVTDLEGKRISFGRATGRYFGKILSNMILLIGFIMAAFTEKKQALHDLIAGTLVVKKV